MFKSKMLSIIVMFIYGSLHCQDPQQVLELAGNNQQTFDKVLLHYKDNPEKYKAALFLIQNMSIHKSVDYQWINMEKSQPINFSEFDFPDYTLAFKYLKDLNNKVGIRPKKSERYDVDVISSESLIHNIDLAFWEWKNNSWSTMYSFETFCEYILPHRSMSEPLEHWREEYKTLADRTPYAMDEMDDPVAVCTHIINSLVDFTFVNKRPDPIPFLSPSQMLFRRQGSCPDLANLALMVCRSKGVAATFDFTPHYAASSNRHFWNTVVNGGGAHIPFNSNAVNDGDDCLPYVYNANKKRLGKVFRKTYSIQTNTLANLIPLSKIPNGALEDKNIKDVTGEYVPVSDLSIRKTRFKDSIAYVNVYNLGQWKVLDWGKVDEDMMVFRELGRDLVYLPGTYDNDTMTYLRHPFLVDREGRQHELVPNTENVFSANLSRLNERRTNYIDFNTLEIIEGETYSLFYWDNGWKRIGTSVAKNKTVFFEDIPSNALYTMVPKKPDRFERIFTIQPNTNQIIWY